MQCKIIDGLASIYEQYTLFLIDLWGVVHNGIRLAPGANECLLQLTHHDKKIVFLSNSPRPSFLVNDLLVQMGLDKAIQYNLITSGSFAQAELNKNLSVNNKLNAFHIGPEEHRLIKRDFALNFVNSITNAELIIATGFNNSYDELADYSALLAIAKNKNLVLHCLNPDDYATIGDKIVKCAGLIAKYYQNMGGSVVYYGKPYQNIYQHIIAQYNIPKAEILAIGDSVEADILGAKNSGIFSLFISNDLDELQVKEKFQKNNTVANYINQYLRWE